MAFLAIVALSILASVAYGIVHDQVTARICVEYFTIGHPPVFSTTSPTLLGLGWGVIATWWVGAILGVALALAARVGPWPKRNAASLVRPVAVLMLACGACAVVAGVVGNRLASSGKVWLTDPLATWVPEQKHVAFLTDLWAHSASYGAGFAGGLVLMVVVLAGRYRNRRRERVG